MLPAGRAASHSRAARFTVSPTTVYSTRSRLPSSAAATWPVLRPMPSPNGWQALRCPGRVQRLLAGVHPGRGRQRPRLVRRRAAPGAPKTAITASPTYCITVPPWARMASFIACRWLVQLRRELGGLGVVSAMPGVAADVRHQHGHGEQLGRGERVGITADPLRQPARQQAGHPLLGRLGPVQLLLRTVRPRAAWPAARPGAGRCRARFPRPAAPPRRSPSARPAWGSRRAWPAGPRRPGWPRTRRALPPGSCRGRRAVAQQVTSPLRRPHGQREVPVTQGPAQRAADRVGRGRAAAGPAAPRRPGPAAPAAPPPRSGTRAGSPARRGSRTS